MKISHWNVGIFMLVPVLFGIWQNFTSVQEVNAVNLLKGFSKNQMASKPIATRPLPEWMRLVDIHSVNRNIQLDIRYATSNNFLNRTLYPEARCILRAGVAQKLSRVQEDLQKMGLGLKVFDCYRPWSVTKQMWEVLPDGRYVANPAQGSRHNRGAAVDLTLVDRQGRELEMPTEFDDFTERAGRDYQGEEVSETARKNSRLLAQVMRKQGFMPLESEWWHFDDKNWSQYSVLDVSFGQITKPN